MHRSRRNTLESMVSMGVAERGGFEPPVRLLTVQRFSKPPPSATRPPHQTTDFRGNKVFHLRFKHKGKKRPFVARHRSPAHGAEPGRGREGLAQGGGAI